MTTLHPPEQRLFFALWPPAPLQTALAGVAAGLTDAGGSPPHRDDLHLTLVFLGNVSRERRHCAEQAAARVRGAAVDLTLDRLGHWPRSRILWAAPDTVPEPLTRLVQDLQGALQACGFAPEPRPFAPHLTLRRQAPGQPPAALTPALSWTAREFVLAVSRSGRPPPRYRILGRWPLAAG
jgi:2'-5' RNA ligase